VKKSPIMLPNAFVSYFVSQNLATFFPWTKATNKFRVTFRIQTETLQSKQSPNWQKCAQSGHPGHGRGHSLLNIFKYLINPNFFQVFYTDVFIYSKIWKGFSSCFFWGARYDILSTYNLPKDKMPKRA
jgi:hypothetical protein